MNNSLKKLFAAGRLIYENLGSGLGGSGSNQLEPEKAPILKSDEETLNQITEVVRLSYEEQLKMMNTIREQLKPLSEDIDKYWGVVTEMHKQLLETGQPQLKDLEMYGKTIQIHMDANSTYWETENGVLIPNIYDWMKQHSPKYQNQ